MKNFVKKLFKIQKNRGMTYVELIVVLGIFAVMSSIVSFNYGEFEANINIKNLANDIALKVVEAQKSSLSGSLPPLTQQTQITPTWKPSYGVYFDITTPNQFIYFTDLEDQDKNLTNPDCSTTISECLDKIIITNNNRISELKVFYANGSNTVLNSDLTVTFSRPSSSAVLFSGSNELEAVSYVQITIASPKSATATIKIYASGRVQVN